MQPPIAPTTPRMDIRSPDATKQIADVEKVENVEDLKNDTANSFPLREDSVKTPEEKKEERRFLRKIDAKILPLLATIDFLASMVRSDNAQFEH